MMTAMQARRHVRSAEHMAELCKRCAIIGQKALARQEFGRAYQFLQKASAFAAALGILQAEFDRTSAFKKELKLDKQ